MVKPDNDSPSPMALAMEWVSRVFAVAVEMIVPGLAGQWLDRRWGTNWFVLVGFAAGISLGLWHLIVMTRAAERRRKPPSDPSRKTPTR